MPIKNELPIEGADIKGAPPVKGDKKMLAYKGNDKAALETLVARVDQTLGYPLIGKAATGCRNVGNGPFVKDEDVKTTAAAHVIADDDGKFFILVTPDVEEHLSSEKAAAATRLQNGTPQAKDVEIAASTTLDKPGV